jgi:hypothetical protein
MFILTVDVSKIMFLDLVLNCFLILLGASIYLDVISQCFSSSCFGVMLIAEIPPNTVEVVYSS